MRLPWVILAMLMLAYTPAVHAQEASRLTLWAHGEVRDGDEVIWINADQGDERATDTANGPGYCPAPTGPTVLGNNAGCAATGQGVALDATHTFTLAMDPALGESAQVAAGKASFTVYLGANSGKCEGTFTSRLANDAGTIAEAKDVAFSFDSGYTAFVAEADVSATDLGDGGDLVWTIDVACEGTGLFLGVHQDTGKSFLTLPLAEPAIEPEVLDPQILVGDVVRADLSTLGSNATHTYVWTNGTDGASGSYWVNVTRGALYLSLSDGVDELWRKTLDASDSGSQDFAGVTGNWTLTLIAEDFAGDIAVSLAVPGRQSNERPENQNEGPTAAPPSTEEGEPAPEDGVPADEPEDEDSPGVPFWTALSVLGTLAFLRRRK